MLNSLTILVLILLTVGACGCDYPSAEHLNYRELHGK